MKKYIKIRKETTFIQRGKYFTLLMVVLAIVTINFTACSMSSGAEQDSVEFWIPFGPPSNVYLRTIVSNYNASSKSSIKVKYREIPDAATYISSLQAAVAAGNPPDVCMLDRFTVPQRANEGLLEDLTEDLNSVNRFFNINYLESAWEETQYGGKTYAVPFDADVRGLYYNIDMIKALGPKTLTRGGQPISYLDALNYLNGPITLLELKEITRDIDTLDSGNYTKVGFVPQMDEGNPYTWGYCFGGDFAGPDGRTVTPEDTGVKAGFQFLSDWYYSTDPAKYMQDPVKIGDFISEFNQSNFDYTKHPFIKGNLAMTIDGDWFIDIIQTYAPKINYGVTFIPIPPATADDHSTYDSFTWTGGYAWCIPSGSTKKAEALKFLVYGCGPAGQTTYCKSFNKAPTLTYLARDFYIPGQPYFLEGLTGTESYSRPPLAVGADYWDALVAAQTSVINGADPASALGQVKTDIQAELNALYY